MLHLTYLTLTVEAKQTIQTRERQLLLLKGPGDSHPALLVLVEKLDFKNRVNLNTVIRDSLLAVKEIKHCRTQ